MRVRMCVYPHNQLVLYIKTIGIYFICNEKNMYRIFTTMYRIFRDSSRFLIFFFSLFYVT